MGIQAHFSQVELPITDYVTDLKSVLDQSIRIIQAMIDVCANSGWLSSSITCMRLLQMVMQVILLIASNIPCIGQTLYTVICRFELLGLKFWLENQLNCPSYLCTYFLWDKFSLFYLQGLWYGRDSPLRMLPCMTDDLISSLNQKGISNVLQLLDLPLTSLQDVTRSSVSSRLYEVRVSALINFVHDFQSLYCNCLPAGI